MERNNFMLVHEAMRFDHSGKPCVTVEEIEARRKRVFNHSYTFALPNKTSESSRKKHPFKIRKETRENISHKSKVMALYLIALCAVFSSNCNKKTKLSIALPLAMATTFALPLRKNAKVRQRS